MNQTKVNADNLLRQEHIPPAALGMSVRTLMLALATITTGLVAGVFYAWSVTVVTGLADLPDASYIAATSAMTERIANPLFFASFLGSPLLLLAALALHLRRPRTARFWLIAAASALYIVGGFLLTMVVNAPMSYGLTEVDPEAPARVLAEARDAYEDTWNFFNGVRAFFSTLAFLALVAACVLPEAHAPQRGSRVR